MFQRNYIISIILLAFSFSQCQKKEEPREIQGCESSDCISISELKTKTNYFLPFRLYNDIPDAQINHLILNNEILDLATGEQLEFEKAGFFELIVSYRTKGNDTILFSLVSEERDHAEWGIEAWIPKMFETSTHRGEEIETIYPRHYKDNMEVPFIFYIRDAENKRKPVYFEAGHTSSGQSFYIKRGVGSANLPASDVLNGSNQFSIGGTGVSLDLTLTNEIDRVLNEDIETELTIPANSIVRIENNISISEGASLTVEEGAILLIAEEVDIENYGPVTFNGSKDNPIVVTCDEPGKYWGGFISENQEASIEAEYTIFCRSGYHNTSAYQWGHANRQALFYTSNSTLTLNNCYMIDHIGQIFYPTNATLSFNNILVQRAKTSGQLNYTQATIKNSVFTDFPDDSLFYEDKDNDALYINASDVTIDSCVFMFAKDDGLDSGGSEGGEITVRNSRFESCFHEGTALSSGNEVTKIHTYEQCTFVNCGQGMELGFSSPNHEVYAIDCQFLNNYIGIRYGDNYDWATVNGVMHISNSQSLYNEKDVWNMVRRRWAPKLDNMRFENVQVSKKSDQYPELEVIE